MTFFIKRIVIFVSLFVFYIAGNLIVNSLRIQNTSLGINHSNILVIGDSHLQCAIDPSVFPDAINICQNSEPLVLTYWKLKRIYQEYCPDTILVGLSPHNISTFNDLKFQDPYWAKEMFKRSYSIEEFSSIDKQISVDYYDFYYTVLAQIGLFPRNNYSGFIGNFNMLEGSDLSDSCEAINRHFFYKGVRQTVSSTSISHIDSIIDLCHTYEVTPIFVSSPVDKSYRNLIPKEFINNMEQVKKHLESRGLLCIDMLNHQYPKSYYFNSDHLNQQGAKEFTNRLKQIFKN